MTSRIVKGDGADAARARPLFSAGSSASQWRRMTRDEASARQAAEDVLTRARIEACEIVAGARRDAEACVANAVREAQGEAQADLSARWLSLRQEEQARIGRDSDRMIALAVVLAERLVGASLAVSPEHIVNVAREVIAEARGARRAVLSAHPTDAEVLRNHLSTVGIDLASVDVREDAGLARGEVRLHTDIGTIDARLQPRLERLAAALRGPVFPPR